MTKGERIKFLRDKMGLSQVSLADKINVSKQTLYKYENDIITNIPSDKVELIAEVTGSTPAYIMGWEDSPIPSYSNVRPIAKKRYPVLGSVACGKPIYMAEEKEVYSVFTISGITMCPSRTLWAYRTPISCRWAAGRRTMSCTGYTGTLSRTSCRPNRIR